MSIRSNRVRTGGRRPATIAGVLGLLMFSGGLSLAVQGGSSAANTTTYPSTKVWVCKFVTDPKGNTTLKNGDDGLVDVAITSLKGFTGLGSLFNDKHVKSIAVAWGNQPKPNVAIVNGVCAVVVTSTSTPTPTPIPSTTTSAPVSSSSAPVSSTSTPSLPSTAPSSATPSSTPTKPGTKPSTVVPSPTATSTPTKTPTKTPTTKPVVVVPTAVHSGLESVGMTGSDLPELGLGMAGIGSVLMLGSMGAIRRTAKR